MDNSSVTLSGTVLDNLQPGTALQSKISATLNASLRTQLGQMATTAKVPVLAGLIASMQDADLVASKNLTLQAFLKQQIDPIVSNDSTMKAAVDSEIAKLSLPGTVASTLSLNSPIASQPALKGIVQDAQLSSLLSASSAIPSDAQARFVSLYGANTADLSTFWSNVSEDSVLGPLVPQIQLTLQLGVLTQNNSALVTQLIAKFQPTNVRDLTSLDTAQLEELITSENVQVPASVASTTTAATIAQYAQSIVGSLQQAFPMVYVAKSFSTSTDTTNQEVAAFLTKSADFDFATTNVNTYLATNTTALAGLTSDQVAAVTDRLKAAQRVYRLVSDGPTMQSLIQLNLDSAYRIASTPSGSFVAQYATALGGEVQAQQIYANATSMTGLTSLIIRQAQENVSGLLPNVLPTDQVTTNRLLSDTIPNWQLLFGTTSTCACSECRAIDGPAAYLVSLLQFLGTLGENAQKNTPLDVLIGSSSSRHGNVTNPRRPDLAHIKLNCANADTALPYVDLVNEILETYVANKRLLGSSARNTPTDATTAVLDVTPEYMQTTDAVTAYAALNAGTIVYPYSLPYDRYLETMRTYLDSLGVSLFQVMYAFGSFLNPYGTPVAPLPRATQLAAEALLLSLPEYSLITGLDFSGDATAAQSLAACFGYAADSQQATWEGSIAVVSTFLNQTGVVFNDLVALLGTQYLNPQHLDPSVAAAISLPANPCDITTMTIQNVDGFLHPLPPFLRLLRKLGWMIAELDYVLRAFPAPELSLNPIPIAHPLPVLDGEATRIDQIDLGGVHTGPVHTGPILPPPAPPAEGLSFIPARFIPIIAQIKYLARVLQLSVSDVVSLWADIDTDGRAAPYISLFQNKAIVNPPDPGLRLIYSVPLASIPSIPPTLISDGTTTTAVSYDATSKQLQFMGTMSDSQLDSLLSWAGSDDATVLAVNLLYSQRWYQGIDVIDSSFEITGFHPLIVEHPIAPGGTVTTKLVPDLVSNHINTILAALRIGASDLTAIRLDTGSLVAGAADEDRLSLSGLSAFHRYAVLAQALGLSVPDLITLKNLTGLNPFVLTNGATGAETDHIVRFVEAAQQVAASPFSIAQLAYLYTSQPSTLAQLQTGQDTTMAAILTGLQNIAAANAFAPDPQGTALRKKLAVLIPSQPQLDATMALIAGNAVYSAQLAELPEGLTLPAGSPVSFSLTATIGGTITAGDTITLTLTAGAAGSTPIESTYTPVLATDTTPGIASALAALIQANA